MNTIVSKEFISATEKEMETYIIRFNKTMEPQKAKQIACEIVKLIDWNNSALMHKGLSWIAKKYLVKQKMM